MTIDRILQGVTEFNQKYSDSYRAALEKLGPHPAPPLAAMLTCTDARHLRFWLRHAEPALAELRGGLAFDASLPDLTQLAQINVINQVRHVMTYPQVRERVDAGQLTVHAWFFDLARAEVQKWDEGHRRFVRIEHASMGLEPGPATPAAHQAAQPTPPTETEPRPFAVPHGQVAQLIQKKRTFRTRM